MKLNSNYLIYVILLASLLATISCKNEQDSIRNYTIEEEVFLHENEIFEYSLGRGISTEGGFTIESQAKHFETSEIKLNTQGLLELQYIYQPKINYTGDDFVILKNCISIGSGNCDKIELFKFTFHVK